MLLAESRSNGITLHYTYDALGALSSLRYTKADGTTTTYYVRCNHAGDVEQIYNTDGTLAARYYYDSWGLPVAVKNASGVTITDTAHIANVNPIRYRGYYYDAESDFYYLQSRYYDSVSKRFMSADEPEYLGADGSPLSYNLFAYCGNNPVMGFDPSGHWDWGGVLTGLAIIATTAVSIATCGVGTLFGALIAGAALTTGAITTYAAATDATMVIDVSLSYSPIPSRYEKIGGSLVIDFKNDTANVYTHKGSGTGSSNGISYSVGVVENYQKAEDYSEYFADANAACIMGIDYCINPLDKYRSAAQAVSITFSYGYSYGIGYDYYSQPYQFLAW